MPITKEEKDQALIELDNLITELNPDLVCNSSVIFMIRAAAGNHELPPFDTLHPKLRRTVPMLVMEDMINAGKDKPSMLDLTLATVFMVLDNYIEARNNNKLEQFKEQLLMAALKEIQARGTN